MSMFGKYKKKSEILETKHFPKALFHALRENETIFIFCLMFFFLFDTVIPNLSATPCRARFAKSMGGRARGALTRAFLYDGLMQQLLWSRDQQACW